jgi:predicted RNA-binding Zn ribbon-like protein
MNLKPPSKIDLHKSFDENDPTNKPAAEKVNVSSIRATKSFSADNLVSEGRFGRVYRAQLCDQKVCSVTFVCLSRIDYIKLMDAVPY